MQPNQTFKSLEEFLSALEKYSKDTNQVFIKRDSKTIEKWASEQKTAPDISEYAKTNIVFQKLIYVCVHWKTSKHNSRGQAIRPKQAYNGKDCKALLNVSNKFDLIWKNLA